MTQMRTNGSHDADSETGGNYDADSDSKTGGNYDGDSETGGNAAVSMKWEHFLVP